MSQLDDARSGNIRNVLTKLRRGRREASAVAVIQAMPQDVWRVVSDVTRIEEWWPRALGGMIIDGDDLGREQVVRVNWGRVEGTIRQKVTVWEPGKRYAWKLVSETAGERLLPPLVDSVVTITIQPEPPAASRVRIEATFDPIGAKGVLALRQLSRLARGSYKKALSNLAGVVAPGR